MTSRLHGKTCYRLVDRDPEFIYGQGDYERNISKFIVDPVAAMLTQLDLVYTPDGNGTVNGKLLLACGIAYAFRHYSDEEMVYAIWKRK